MKSRTLLIVAFSVATIAALLALSSGSELVLRWITPSPTTVAQSIESSAEWSMWVEPQEVHSKPGDSFTLDVFVATPNEPVTLHFHLDNATQFSGEQPKTISLTWVSSNLSSSEVRFAQSSKPNKFSVRIDLSAKATPGLYAMVIYATRSPQELRTITTPAALVKISIAP